MVCERKNLHILNSNTPTSQKSTNIIELIICSEPLIHRISDILLITILICQIIGLFILIFQPSRPVINMINWSEFKASVQSKLQEKLYVIESNDDLEQEALVFSAEIVDLLKSNNKQQKSYKSKIPQ